MDCFSLASSYTPSENIATTGSVKIVVGKNAKVYASLLSAAKDILVNAKNLDMEGKGEAYFNKVTIANKGKKRKRTEEVGIIIQKVRAEAVGNITIQQYIDYLMKEYHLNEVIK
jgi:hypothetical protein